MRKDDARLDRVLSYTIRQRFESGQVARVSVALINEIAENTVPPALATQADNLIVWIGDHLTPGVSGNFTARECRSVIGSGSVHEFTMVGRHLVQSPLLERAGSHKDGIVGALSFAGWERYETIKRQRSVSPQASASTGWERVDRRLDKMRTALEAGAHEEDFQQVGLLVRETLISLAQQVYDRGRHPAIDGVEASPTDAKRMLEGYIAVEIAGDSYEHVRKYARSCLNQALALQHGRNASFRDAALCYEFTASVVRSIAIISGRCS